MGVVSPPLRGVGQPPVEFVLGPYIRWANLPMVLCMVFAHGFGRKGFWYMVLNASACIYMYCNIEMNIMKKINLVVPFFGFKGKSMLYLFYVLCSRYFLFYLF